MKFSRRILALLTLSAPLLARQVPAASPDPVSVAIDNIELKDVGTDRIRFDISSHVTATRKLGIKQVHFEQMRLGTLPIYLRPIEDHLELEKEVAVSLPRIPLTIYFRDLDSLAPLQQAVQDGQATVEGKARVDLDLNLIERIASRQWNAHADLPIQMKIPVEVPGGFVGKAAALTTLKGAQLALDLGGSALNALRQRQKRWEQDLRAHYVPALVIAESRYSVRTRNNERMEFSVRGLGFRISEDAFVLTGEMMEPWRYDSDVAAALQNGDATLLEDSRDLLVWPSGEALTAEKARSFSRGEIKLEHSSGKTETAHVPGADNKTVTVKLLQRDSGANYAVLRFTRSEDKGKPVELAPEDARRSQNWDRLTLFRVDDNGKLELISTPARRQDNRILLEDPIDDRAFGSLLVAPEGAVGMVQDESTGMILRPEW
jgi:hypothetical protein